MTFKRLKSGSILVELPEASYRYGRTPSNQLILCARMNDWTKFEAMWKKKTTEDWPKLGHFLSELDSSGQWKVKETFARLATQDEESNSDEVVFEKALP